MALLLLSAYVDADLLIREIEQSLLAENERLLKEVIGLLVNAHYQTREDCSRRFPWEGSIVESDP